MSILGRKISAVLISAVLAFLILLAGQIPWSLLLSITFRNRPSAVPWSVAAMAIVLWLIWQYLGGKGWPRSTSETRRRYLRANRVPAKPYVLALFSGILSSLWQEFGSFFFSWPKHPQMFSPTVLNSL